MIVNNLKLVFLNFKTSRC